MKNSAAFTTLKNHPIGSKINLVCRYPQNVAMKSHSTSTSNSLRKTALNSGAHGLPVVG